VPFESKLRTEYIGAGNSMLITPLVYRIPGSNSMVYVPRAFVTDFASIPRVFRVIVTGQDNTKLPAVVHDFLYSKHIGSRAWADGIFLKAMKDEGVPWWKRSMCYSGVRAGGWIAWRNKAND
jgi:hypothetical protein